MSNLGPLIANYVAQTKKLAGIPSSTESTFYPDIKTLLAGILKEHTLPFEARTSTSEAKGMPDFVLADSAMFVGVYGEVKRESTTLEGLAISTEQNDQIGRYLSWTGVVLLSNVRGLGLLACRTGYERNPEKPVPPADRELLKTVDIWAAISGSASNPKVDPSTIDDLVEIIVRSVTDYAPIADPADLAKILARQARDAKAALPDDLKPLAPLLDDYRQALGLAFDVSDERGDRFFRSSLVQTLFYSLFAAWILWDRVAAAEVRFETDDAHKYLMIPFLDALLHDIRHPARMKQLGLEQHVERAVATLNRVDRKLFRARMHFPTIDEQTAIAAITYFYEPFLEAFDPELREDLGVWYTPPEIVRYQVRRIHHLLKTELKRARGLADPEVYVLDPCCGTGAYLLEIARCIAEEVKSDGDDATLALELAQAFQSRVIGFEILTAPFAIAQLQLYLLLQSLGAKKEQMGRLAVFLTNSLSGWNDTGGIKLNFPEMRDEYDASQAVKRKTPIIVILGNPPYDAFAGAAVAEEAELVAHYKGVELTVEVDRKTKQTKLDEFGRPKKKQKGDSLLYMEYGVRKQLLNDLYVRFLRLAEERIGEKAEYGIVSFISNSSYLTGRSHPLMRQSLLTNFHSVWIDNLNGDKYRTGKLIPQGLPGAGTADQSAFTTELDPRGIQPGTAIVTWLKRKAPKALPTETTVLYRDFWGLANSKRVALIASLSVDEGKDQPSSTIPSYSQLKPTRGNRWRLSPHTQDAGYESWPGLDELFPTAIQGVNHNRGIEGTVIDSEKKSLETRIQRYISFADFESASAAEPDLAKSFAGYDAKEVWGDLKKAGFNSAKVLPFLTFPFDERFIYYEPDSKLLNRARPEFGRNLSENEFLVTVPEPRKISESRPVYSTELVNLHVHERGSVVFPREMRGDGLFDDREANIDELAWRTLRKHFGLSGERSDNTARKLVGNLFRCVFSILHAPAYQAEHASALGADWAHLPIPKSQDAFSRLIDAGQTVIGLLDAHRDARNIVEAVLGHDCTSALGALRKQDGQQVAPDDLKITVIYWGGGKGRWKPRAFTEEEKPANSQIAAWGDRTGDLFINDTTFFANVPEAVWTYQLGGYPVLKKWLGYRQADRRAGKPLTDMERRWFRSTIQRISALLALSPRLDSLYQEVSADCFTTAELGISPEAARERRDAKKKKVGNAKLTPAMKPKPKPKTKTSKKKKN
jgi:hypothetical protein